MQTKKHSFIESMTNILIGYGVAVTSQIIIFPWFGINIPISDNLLIGFYFTLISLVRSYVLRRYFNRKTIKNTYAYRSLIAGSIADYIIIDDLEEKKPLTEEEKLFLSEWYDKCFSKYDI